MSVVPVDFLRIMFAILVALSVALSVYLASWLAVDVRSYTHLHSVDVVQTDEGLMVDVSRENKRDFVGGYYVSIRPVTSHPIECATGDVRIDYEATEGRKTFRKSLAWWAEGGSCDRRLRSPFAPGLYVMVTCHFVKHPWLILPRKTRCVESIFEVTG